MIDLTEARRALIAVLAMCTDVRDDGTGRAVSLGRPTLSANLKLIISPLQAGALQNKTLPHLADSPQFLDNQRVKAIQ